MSDWHSFSVDVACEVGVNAAILLGNIKHWCQKNAANGKHYHEGLYWTYNTVKAMSELYPYLGKKAIDNALRKLEEGGYIRIANYNKNAYDRTRWYAITDKGLALFGETHFPKGEMEKTERGNGNSRSGKPIPDIDQMSTSSLPDIPPEADEPPVGEIMEYFNAKTGKHFSPKARNTVKEVTGRWNDYPDKTRDERLAMFRKVIDNMCTRWIGTTQEQWLVPSTIFRASHFDDYLNATPTPPKQSEQVSSQQEIDLSDFAESRKRWEEYIPEEVRR
jgi:uncharacterized phage protein (TIGR02220 family)